MIIRDWSSPISHAIVIFDEDDLMLVNQYVKKNVNQERVEISIYKEDKDQYPINKLRNVAISKSKTSHYFIDDIDLWPSSIEDLYSDIMV